MPVEIRELIIKTEIHSQSENHKGGLSDRHLRELKKELLDETLNQLRRQEKSKRSSFNR